MKRRDLLKYSGVFVGGAILYRPSLRLVQKIFEGNLHQNRQLTKQEIRNYIQFNLYGAPSRWGFDSLLKPYEDSAFIQNKFVGNTLSPAREGHLGWDISYQTITVNGLNVPPLWNETTKQNKKFSSLLENALFIRGCRLNFEGHPVNGAQQVAPVTGELSIHGRIADKSNALFSSISLGHNAVSRAYKSTQSQLSDIPVSEKNYAEYLMRPYLIQDAERVFDTSDLEKDIELIAAGYKDQNVDTAKIKKDTLKDIKNNIDQFLADYSSLFIKYTQIIQDAVAGQILEHAIATPSFPFEADGKKDLMEMIGPYLISDKLCQSENIFEFMKTGEIQYWAQEFALCEFLIKNQLCQSILISPPNETGDLIKQCHAKNVLGLNDLELKYDSKFNKSSVHLRSDASPKALSYQDVQMDSHHNGAFIEVLSTKLFYKTFTSCLYEFIDQLKMTKIDEHTSLFDQSIVHVASEFDRNPDQRGGGSDHLPLSNPTLLFSGLIKETTVIGNIYTGTLKKNPYDLYGTLGVGAPCKELKAPIGIVNVSSTICQLVGIDPLVKRAPSLIEIKNNQVQSVLSKPLNLEGIV